MKDLKQTYTLHYHLREPYPHKEDIVCTLKWSDRRSYGKKSFLIGALCLFPGLFDIIKGLAVDKCGYLFIGLDIVLFFQLFHLECNTECHSHYNAPYHRTRDMQEFYKRIRRYQGRYEKHRIDIRPAVIFGNIIL